MHTAIKVSRYRCTTPSLSHSLSHIQEWYPNMFMLMPTALEFNEVTTKVGKCVWVCKCVGVCISMCECVCGRVCVMCC